MFSYYNKVKQSKLIFVVKDCRFVIGTSIELGWAVFQSVAD